MVKLNDVIRIKRQAMGLTQSEFASKVGVTSSTISNFEKGYEISEVIIRNIKFTIRDLESKLNPDDLGPYKLRTSVELAILEQDHDAKMEKLHSVMYSALKWVDLLDKKKRGFINY